MAIYFHKKDLPADVVFEGDLAIDTESTGLHLGRDRLCLVQISDGRGDAHLVHFSEPDYSAPNLKALLSDESRVKIFHYARADMAIIYKCLGLMLKNMYCTKIASKMARTYTDSHSLKDLCRDLLHMQISKQQQCSNWGASTLSKEQLEYAAGDVLQLHKLRILLEEILRRENRSELVAECFPLIETIVRLDLAGWNGHEIFSYKSAP